jgi:hypothetical protein
VRATIGAEPLTQAPEKTENAEAMIWKLLRVAEKSWRTLNAPKLMEEVYEGKRFKDGIAVRMKIELARKPPDSLRQGGPRGTARSGAVQSPTAAPANMEKL